MPNETLQAARLEAYQEQERRLNCKWLCSRCGFPWGSAAWSTCSACSGVRRSDDINRLLNVEPKEHP